MWTEDDFQRRLDECPDDHTCRLVFADWLEERGDPRAEGYRALGVWKRRPFLGGSAWCWWWKLSGSHFHPDSFHNALPADWFAALEGDKDSFFPVAGRRMAAPRYLEDAAALAFAKLPPERRAELLTPASATV